MGLFGSALGAIGGGGIAGGLGAFLGSGAGGAIGNAIAPQVQAAKPPPEVDPRLRSMRDKQFQLAQEYREKAPGLAEQRYALAGDQARRGLQGDIKQIGTSANSRGLLYSGLRQGAEAQAGQQAASGLAQRRASIIGDVEGQQNQMDRSAIQSGLNVQNIEQGRLDQIYQDAMKRRQEQMALNQSPVGIIGNVLKG